jgi:hypothetical protein
MKVQIHRVKLTSLGRMGCLLGIVAAFLPSLLCGLLGMGLTGLIHRWLSNWQEVPLSFLGQEITTFDFVQLLGLEKALDVLQVLTSASGAMLALVVLALALLSGLLLALITMIVGLSYNLLASATGGVVVEMQVPRKKDPAGEEAAQHRPGPNTEQPS